MSTLTDNNSTTINDEIYVSIDVESDGPIPGENSMLALGAAAYRDNGDLIGSFSANLELLPGATPDPKTMAWWATQPEAWDAHRQHTEDPKVVMKRFVKWAYKLTSNPGNLVCVAYPAGFDWTYVYWYMMKFVGRSPFSFSCIDIKTLAMAALGGKSYRGTSKRVMPDEWFPKNLPHTHIAVDDAVEQGALFCNILKAVRRRK